MLFLLGPGKKNQQTKFCFQMPWSEICFLGHLKHRSWVIAAFVPLEFIKLANYLQRLSRQTKKSRLPGERRKKRWRWRAWVRRVTKHLSDGGPFSLESTIHFIGTTHILKAKETLNFPLCFPQRKQGDLPACLFRQERALSGGKKTSWSSETTGK